jgi:hypothetical protein
MDADDLLQALAARERERLQARPEEWEGLAHGRISPDDAVAAARARGPVDEQELAHTRELFTPPSPEFDEALVARLVAMTHSEAMPAALVGEAPANGHPVIHAEHRWWRPRAAMVAAGVMAAAAAILVVAWPRHATDETGARVQLPNHQMWIESPAEVRGSENVKTLAPGAAFTLYLRPERGYGVVPNVAACLRKGDETRVLEVSPSTADAGTTMDLAARLPDDVGAGRWEVIALIAGGALPSDIAASCASPPADVKVSRDTIDVAR